MWLLFLMVGSLAGYGYAYVELIDRISARSPVKPPIASCPPPVVSAANMSQPSEHVPSKRERAESRREWTHFIAALYSPLTEPGEPWTLPRAPALEEMRKGTKSNCSVWTQTPTRGGGRCVVHTRANTSSALLTYEVNHTVPLGAWTDVVFPLRTRPRAQTAATAPTADAPSSVPATTAAPFPRWSWRDAELASMLSVLGESGVNMQTTEFALTTSDALPDTYLLYVLPPSSLYSMKPTDREAVHEALKAAISSGWRHGSSACSAITGALRPLVTDARLLVQGEAGECFVRYSESGVVVYMVSLLENTEGYADVQPILPPPPLPPQEPRAPEPHTTL